MASATTTVRGSRLVHGGDRWRQVRDGGICSAIRVCDRSIEGVVRCNSVVETAWTDRHRTFRLPHQVLTSIKQRDCHSERIINAIKLPTEAPAHRQLPHKRCHLAENARFCHLPLFFTRMHLALQTSSSFTISLIIHVES